MENGGHTGGRMSGQQVAGPGGPGAATQAWQYLHTTSWPRGTPHRDTRTPFLSPHVRSLLHSADSSAPLRRAGTPAQGFLTVGPPADRSDPAWPRQTRQRLLQLPLRAQHCLCCCWHQQLLSRSCCPQPASRTPRQYSTTTRGAWCWLFLA